MVSVRISCSHYGLCALVRCDRLFKGSRIHESRSNKMYLAQYPFYIQDLSAEQLHYIRSCFYMCTMIILIVCGTSFRNTWKRIRRFEPIVAATTISRGSGRTSIWHRIKDCNELVSHGYLLNRAINALPFELHIPTSCVVRLMKRLIRGDINCWTRCAENTTCVFTEQRSHDRHAADKVLADKALSRVAARDSVLSERAAAIV